MIKNFIKVKYFSHHNSSQQKCTLLTEYLRARWTRHCLVSIKWHWCWWRRPSWCVGAWCPPPCWWSPSRAVCAPQSSCQGSPPQTGMRSWSLDWSGAQTAATAPGNYFWNVNILPLIRTDYQHKSRDVFHPDWWSRAECAGGADGTIRIARRATLCSAVQCSAQCCPQVQT